MTEVRRHQRQTASGKTVSVRHHTRDTGEGARQGWADRVAQSSAYYPAPPPPEPPETAPVAEDWWDGDDADPGGDWWDDNDLGKTRMDEVSGPGEKLSAMLADMRDWRSRPEPQPQPHAPMSPQLAELLGCDTPEGRARYDRRRAYREAGYDGPLDQDDRIPDPDDPANYDALATLAAMRK